MISESKVTLASLLAEEEILVEERSGVIEPYFDLQNRMLVMPIYKRISTDILDLIISHEVGHALFTPTEEWDTAIKSISIDLLNILEDSRIERLIKTRFPGLKIIYYRAYQEIYDKDFFGINHIIHSKMNLIDRINITEKFGVLPEIQFTKSELKYLIACRKTKTFNDVVKLARVLQQFIKTEKKNEPYLTEEIIQQIIDDSVNSVEYFDTFDDIIDDLKPVGSSDDFDENENSDGKNSLSSDNDDDLLSQTLSNFDQSLLELIDDNVNVIYADIPDVPLSKMIVSYDTLIFRLKTECSNIIKYNKKYDLTLFNQFKNKNNSKINYLLKEFQLKKSAKNRKKEKIAKTGDLNNKRLYSYLISDDIFKSNVIIHKDQSHGLVFFLDWSGSMLSHIKETIHQLLTLVLFCKKLQIPFEVYTFSDSYSSEDKTKTLLDYKQSNQKLQLSNLSFLHILSSKMDNRQFEFMANFLLNINVSIRSRGLFQSYSDNNSTLPRWLSLNSTPLNIALLFTRRILDDFQKKNNVQKVNCIYLTDGESDSLKFDKSIIRYHTKIYLRDKEKHVTCKLQNNVMYDQTDDCARFVRQTCKYKFLGFRLISSREFSNNVKSSIARKQFKKTNFYKKDITGFDEYYYIRNTGIIDEELDFDENETVGNITKAFKQSMEGSTNTRTFLKQYIEFIA